MEASEVCGKREHPAFPSADSAGYRPWEWRPFCGPTPGCLWLLITANCRKEHAARLFESCPVTVSTGLLLRLEASRLIFEMLGALELLDMEPSDGRHCMT
jgi:hypothetical protein